MKESVIMPGLFKSDVISGTQQPFILFLVYKIVKN